MRGSDDARDRGGPTRGGGCLAKMMDFSIKMMDFFASISFARSKMMDCSIKMMDLVH